MKETRGISFEDQFDKIYMINLPEEVKRREGSLLALEEAGINSSKVEVVKALNGTQVPWSEEEEENATEGWNANAKALAKKTLQLVVDARKKGYKKILIFEDDIKLVSNFHEIYNKFASNLPAKWDFVHLNASHHQPAEYYGPYINKIKYAWCCQAYIISSEVFDEYIKRLTALDKPIDQTTADIHLERGNSYCPSVNLVYHEPFNHSTLRDKIVNY